MKIRNLLLTYLKNIIGNKVVIYLVTRYFIYFLSFISSLVIANKLGPYYMGIWGFILLILRYFHLIDFGIGNSMTVILVKNKKEQRTQAEYEVTAMILLGLMSLCIVIISIYNYCHGISWVEKYDLGALFYVVMGIAIMQYYNDYFLKVYRAKGKIFEFTFYQSILQILTFIVIFFVKGERLIILLTLALLFGHTLSLLLFALGKGIHFYGKPSIIKGKTIINKGLFLFVYNFSFYMIIVSTKTLIGAYYSIEEFGYFTFSYTIAHAALLLLTAFSSLITPKLIDKFNTEDINEIDRTVRLIRIDYVYLSHGLMYAAMMLFPILLLLMPKYAVTIQVLNLTALATVLYTNSFGYTSFLMSKNKEKILAKNSFFSLIINVLLIYVLILVFKVTYTYVVIGTLLSYFAFAYFTVYSGKKELSQPTDCISILRECFPIGILVPFVGAIGITLLNISYLMFIPFILFITLNMKEIKEIFLSLKKIIFKPQIVDVK